MLQGQAGLEFQSTLPAWGATFPVFGRADAAYLFQSTLPAWGATYFFLYFLFQFIISIHAPRMGSDKEI